MNIRAGSHPLIQTIFIYLSAGKSDKLLGDWSAADVQTDRSETYPDYMRAQLKELLSNYGDIKMLWFDNYWYVDNQWQNDEKHAKELYAYVRSLNPNVLVNDRCG